MTVLTRFTISNSRLAGSWVANPYRVHQRLMMAYEGEPRLLFRIEPGKRGTCILAQSSQLPDWHAAFDNFSVLLSEPQSKQFNFDLLTEQFYRFRLLANPTVTREGKRLGLVKEEDQLAWLERQFSKSGAKLMGCRVINNGLQHSGKNPYKQEADQVHLAVRFDGLLRVENPAALQNAALAGIGPAKGYGFGLLSLAVYQPR